MYLHLYGMTETALISVVRAVSFSIEKGAALLKAVPFLRLRLKRGAHTQSQRFGLRFFKKRLSFGFVLCFLCSAGGGLFKGKGV